MTHTHEQHGAGTQARTLAGAVPEADLDAMAELIDLDAEVLHAYLNEVMAWLQELTAGRPGHRFLDLGSGTGTGTLALLQHFPAAEVTAVDKSGPMLDRLRRKAAAQGAAGRVHVVEADLDAGWPDTGPVDLVWASASLHHMAAPDRVLASVLAALRPGGLLAVAEMDSFPRFLPDDLGLGEPGLEVRCHAALAHELAGEVPHLGSDWGPWLSRAGFAVEAKQVFAVSLAPPLPAAAGRYAQACLRRMRPGLEGRVSAVDLATLDTLIGSDGPDGVLRRGDLAVRATRTVWMARRSASSPY
jgi:SAM-dependent methyltransferase